MSKINKQSLQKAGGIVLALAIAGITGYLVSQSVNNKKIASSKIEGKKFNSKKVAKNGKAIKKSKQESKQQKG